jgi:hypothetical protein
MAAEGEKILQQMPPLITAAVVEGLTHFNSIGGFANANARTSLPAVHVTQQTLAHLRLYLNNPNAEFKSPQQALAIQMGLCSKDSFFAVLPTGGGKTATYILYHFVNRASTDITVVIVPHVALLMNLQRQCGNLRIRQARWELGVHVGAASVVLVTSDMSSKVEFREYLTSLSIRLRAIVYEECHVYVTDTSYRRSLLYVRDLAVFPCQKILLSATAPAGLYDEILKVLNVPHVYPIRAPCVRPEIAPHVHKTVKAGEYEGRYKKVLNHCLAGTTQNECIIVFCQERDECERRAKEAKENGVSADYYHAHCSPEHKKRVMEGVERKLFRVIFCTLAFGTGVDIHGVRHIIHLGAPDHLIEYAQESGRCARDGRVSEVHLIYRYLPISVLPGEEVLGTLALREYMTSPLCHRLLFSKFFDGCGHSCVSHPGAQKCRICVPLVYRELSANGQPVAQVQQAPPNGLAPISPPNSPRPLNHPQAQIVPVDNLALVPVRNRNGPLDPIPTNNPRRQLLTGSISTVPVGTSQGANLRPRREVFTNPTSNAPPTVSLSYHYHNSYNRHTLFRLQIHRTLANELLIL